MIRKHTYQISLGGFNPGQADRVLRDFCKN
ncbi:MAG: hypothetical protein JWO06_332, partial [Bacteroidota bacterium]|nr:hypothetical protein [Bacteroidota bacterium]